MGAVWEAAYRGLWAQLRLSLFSPWALPPHTYSDKPVALRGRGKRVPWLPFAPPGGKTQHSKDFSGASDSELLNWPPLHSTLPSHPTSTPRKANEPQAASTPAIPAVVSSTLWIKLCDTATLSGTYLVLALGANVTSRSCYQHEPRSRTREGSLYHEFRISGLLYKSRWLERAY